MSVANPVVMDEVSSGWRRGGAWLYKGGLALGDQGLISGSNFAISVLLARWLAADAYGAYALAFATFLLVSQLHQALLLEPMSVYGGAMYRGRLREYLGALLWMHTAAAGVIAVLLGAAGAGAILLHRGGALGGALIGVSLASPCILLFWLVRRAFYLELRPELAARGALVYSAVLVVLLAAVYRLHALSPLTAFLIMGGAALLTSVLFLRRLRPEVMPGRNELCARSTAWQHWRYGRWALASAVAMWVPSNLYYLLLSGGGGMAHAGELRALMNLTLPVGQTATALSLLFVPYASRVRAEKGSAALQRVSLMITALFAVGGIAYWALVAALRNGVLHALYGGRYQEIGSLIPAVALASILQSAINGPAIGLRAGERPKSVFYAYLLSSVVTIAGGVLASRWFGVAGAVCTMAIASGAAFCVACVMLWRGSGREAEAV